MGLLIYILIVLTAAVWVICDAQTNGAPPADSRYDYGSYVSPH